MRCVMARVLPVPAPASTQSGPGGEVTAARCSASRPASTSAVSTYTPSSEWSTTAGMFSARYDVKPGCRRPTQEGHDHDLDRPVRDDVLDALVRVLPSAQEPV